MLKRYRMVTLSFEFLTVVAMGVLFLVPCCSSSPVVPRPCRSAANHFGRALGRLSIPDLTDRPPNHS